MCRGKKLKLLQQLFLPFLQNALAHFLRGSQLALQPWGLFWHTPAPGWLSCQGTTLGKGAAPYWLCELGGCPSNKIQSIFIFGNWLSRILLCAVLN